MKSVDVQFQRATPFRTINQILTIKGSLRAPLVETLVSPLSSLPQPPNICLYLYKTATPFVFKITPCPFSRLSIKDTSSSFKRRLGSWLRGIWCSYNFFLSWHYSWLHEVWRIRLVVSPWNIIVDFGNATMDTNLLTRSKRKGSLSTSWEKVIWSSAYLCSKFHQFISPKVMRIFKQSFLNSKSK